MTGWPQLVARCTEDFDGAALRCDGELRYQWGQTEAACDVCGARCGIAVADWSHVETVAGADLDSRGLS